MGVELPVMQMEREAAVFAGPVAIADDDLDQANVVADLVSALDYEPMILPGPFDRIEAFADVVMARAGALICDHLLRHGQFAPFDGAEIVAALYGRKPAVLLTSYLNTEEIIPIRRLRRFIPA